MTKEEENAFDKYLIEIWKKLIDLHALHETLKQSRLRIFVPVLGALMASYYLVVSQIEVTKITECKNIARVLAGFLIAAGSTYYTWTIRKIDRRAKDYVEVIKRQIRHIEKLIQNSVAYVHYLPYEGQHQILNENTLAIGDEYPAYKMIQTSKNKKPSVRASSMEQSLLRNVFVVWLICLAIHSYIAIKIVLNPAAELCVLRLMTQLNSGVSHECATEDLSLQEGRKSSKSNVQSSAK